MTAQMFRSVLVVYVISLMIGCAPATPPVETAAPPASFWQNRAAKTGVATVTFPKGAEHMVGPQDPLDKAIAAEVDHRLGSYLRRIQPSEFTKITQDFSTRLQTKGYAVTLIPGPIDPTQYAVRQTKGSKPEVDRDFTPLRTKYGVERILSFSIDRFGTIRSYVTFVPAGAPMAIFQAHGALIDLTSHEVLWRASMTVEQSVIRIEGEWDQPPDYPNITRAIRRAEHDAVVYLEDRFFAATP